MNTAARAERIGGSEAARAEQRWAANGKQRRGSLSSACEASMCEGVPTRHVSTCRACKATFARDFASIGFELLSSSQTCLHVLPSRFAMGWNGQLVKREEELRNTEVDTRERNRTGAERKQGRG
eukprot:6177297-Pleurochrysis_carterae.AAC.2